MNSHLIYVMIFEKSLKNYFLKKIISDGYRYWLILEVSVSVSAPGLKKGKLCQIFFFHHCLCDGAISRNQVKKQTILGSKKKKEEYNNTLDA